MKKTRIDITGNRFGELTAIRFSHIGNNLKPFWECLCKCGGTKTVRSNDLRRGKIISCGCYKPVNTVEDFWTAVDKSGGCWNWVRSKRSGYGQTRWNGKLLFAHRLSYELTYGDIPKGLFVLHKCDNRACVNPTHLFIGSQQDNMTDMKNKGRGRNQFSNRGQNA